MANTEKRFYRDELHLFLAFRRRKTNQDGPIRCFREIIYDEAISLERLKVKVRTVPGVWRIHRTVNPRDVAKAAKVLQKRLIDDPRNACSLDQVWRTCLLQKESRGGRRFLVDIDDPAQLPRCLEIIGDNIVGEPVPTPSGGYHVVCESFDARPLRALDEVDVQPDGYLFVEQMTVE